jgi:hypothetical protein
MPDDEIAFSSFAPHELRFFSVPNRTVKRTDKTARVDQKCIECRQDETPARQYGDTFRARVDRPS